MRIAQTLPACTSNPAISSLQRTRLATALVTRIARDIAKGAGHLHRLKPMLIHRDLKSNNILVRGVKLPFSSPDICGIG